MDNKEKTFYDCVTFISLLFGFYCLHNNIFRRVCAMFGIHIWRWFTCLLKLWFVAWSFFIFASWQERAAQSRPDLNRSGFFCFVFGADELTAHRTSPIWPNSFPHSSPPCRTVPSQGEGGEGLNTTSPVTRMEYRWLLSGTVLGMLTFQPRNNVFLLSCMRSSGASWSRSEYISLTRKNESLFQTTAAELTYPVMSEGGKVALA